jgi:hypothetical protein
MNGQHKYGVRKPDGCFCDNLDIANEVLYFLAGRNLNAVSAMKVLEFASGLVNSHSILCRAEETTAETPSIDSIGIKASTIIYYTPNTISIEIGIPEITCRFNLN